MNKKISQSKTMRDLVEKEGPSLIPLKKGTTLEVKIISITRNKILVNVNDLCLGIIPEKEFSTEAIDLKPGDKILAYLIDLENEEGYAVFSLRRADKERIWQDLRNKLNSGDIVKVRVVEANRGGLIVQYGSLEGFLPISRLSSKYYSLVNKHESNQMIGTLKKLIGQVLESKVINLDQFSNKLIFSEKEVSRAQQKEKIKGLFKLGQRVKGKISGIVPFGLFINLGEIEGLVHISEISWERISDLNRLFKIGDQVEAEIIDLENDKVSLSIKRLSPDPWLKTIKKYKPEQEVEGKVTRITPFGAFVELNNTISGLVHISELALQARDQKTIKPEDILEIDKKYKFKINKIEPEAHKISLSFVPEKREETVKKKSTVKEKKSSKK